jgi:hypothetical protein
MKCVQCGQNELTSGDRNGVCVMCENGKLYPFPQQQGWICPKCGSVYGPFHSECGRCNKPQKFEVTCSCDNSCTCSSESHCDGENCSCNHESNGPKPDPSKLYREG